jgi:hypothetical protein
MNATAETHEWTYRNLDCLLYALESSDLTRYIGYVSIADKIIEVVDTDTTSDVSDVKDTVESEVDLIVNGIADDEPGMQPMNPLDPDVDPDPNPLDPDPEPLNPDPPSPYRRYRWDTAYLGLDNGSVIDLVTAPIGSQPFDTDSEKDVRFDI